MITLTKFTDKDQEFYEKLVYNEEVMNMNYGRVFTEDEVDFLYKYIVEYNKLNIDSGYYKVFLDEQNCFIGLGSLAVEDKTAEVEYMLLPDFWHRGFATAILNKLLKIGQEIGVNRVDAITDPENVISRRILEKEGFSLEKEYINEDGCPAVLYSHHSST